MNAIQSIEKIKEIKAKIDELSLEKSEIETQLPPFVVFKNEDGTWTRFTKIDNVEELKRGPVFRAQALNRYTTKIETLKNEPKEKVQVEA